MADFILYHLLANGGLAHGLGHLPKSRKALANSGSSPTFDNLVLKKHGGRPCTYFEGGEYVQCENIKLDVRKVKGDTAVLVRPNVP